PPDWCVVSRTRGAAKTKARVAGAARAFGSHEIVEDQDVTATSATRPKSRVATRASVQQQSVASCIRTRRAMPKSLLSVRGQRHPRLRFCSRAPGGQAPRRGPARLSSPLPPICALAAAWGREDRRPDTLSGDVDAGRRVFHDLG